MSDVIGGKGSRAAAEAPGNVAEFEKLKAEREETARRERERREEENKRERARQAIITTRAQRPGRSILTQRPVNSILGS